MSLLNTDILIHEQLKKEANSRGLPVKCWAKDPLNGEIICIWFGQPGYEPAPHLTEEKANGLNSRRNITAKQIEAMESGAAFGWHVPAAFPNILPL